MVNAETLQRTQCGLFPTFEHVFINAHYVPVDQSSAGSIPRHAPGDLFIATPVGGRELLPASTPQINKKWHVLSATPVIQLPRFSPRVAPRSGEAWVTQGPGCIRILPWWKDGAFLILAGDPNHMRDIWLGFVPMDQRITVNTI